MGASVATSCNMRINSRPHSHFLVDWNNSREAGVMRNRWALIGMVLVVAELLALSRAHAATQDLTCLIQPYVVITITTPVGGLLEAVQVDRGDLVKEGQIL